MDEPEQVEGVPTVCSMAKLLASMLSVGVTTRLMVLLLTTGVLLAHTRELVTLTETSPLTGALMLKKPLPLTVMPPGDHT